MKEKAMDLIRSIVISIGIAMAIFCFVGVTFDMRYGGNFTLDNYRFTKMVIGCVLIGLGFGIPSIVYNKEELPMPIKIIIHMGIGCVVYTIVAHYVGWMGGAATARQGIIIAAIQLGTAFIIWLMFLRYYRKDAVKMNERLQQINKEMEK